MQWYPPHRNSFLATTAAHWPTAAIAAVLLALADAVLATARRPLQAWQMEPEAGQGTTV